MNRRESLKSITLGAITPAILLNSCNGFSPFSPNEAETDRFDSYWQDWPNLEWTGPEFWGNRLQDWVIRDGKALCRASAPNRSLHVLIAQTNQLHKPFTLKSRFQFLNTESSDPEKHHAGFLLGARGRFDDYQSSAVFGKGLIAGINLKGFPFIGDSTGDTPLDISQEIDLTLEAIPLDKGFQMVLTASNTNKEGKPLKVISQKNFSSEELTGNIALHCDLENAEKEAVSFSSFSLYGEKLTIRPSQTFGPICFAQYTLHNKVLKMNAQLSPVEMMEEHSVELQLRESDWKTVQTVKIHPEARVAQFRLEEFEKKADVPYRVLLTLPLKSGKKVYEYQGSIHVAPENKETLKAAVFSCNADHGFPDSEVPENVLKHKPDIAFFLGDQFYESTGGYGIQTSPLEMATLDYLRKWMMFGWSYRDIFRNVPCAFIPDDHDVYHGNVWGEGGKRADTSEGWNYTAQDSGGYKMPAEWVNMVQVSQTSHLPDPIDPESVKQGINVYFTNLTFGGVSFAILEDRKFKSAPKRILPEEAKVVNGFIQNPDFDVKAFDDSHADLLGERQLNFLDNWSSNWEHNAQMKVVLSQTNFCTLATLPKGEIIDKIVPSLPIPKKGEYVAGDAPTRDMDSNGWPKTGRDKALEKLRKCFAFHIAGDQHLGSVVHYGIDEYGDAGFAFAGPALNNLWPRRWWPDVKEDHTPLEGKPGYTGNFEDGFGNKVTVHAVANPFFTGREPSRIYDRATGYGIVNFNLKDRSIDIECWPRYIDPLKEPKGQYDGWPMKIKQTDNYGREAAGHLPEFICSEPGVIIEVYTQNTKQLLYSLRLPENSFKPPVYDQKSAYKVVFRTDEGKRAVYENLTTKAKQTVEVKFS